MELIGPGWPDKRSHRLTYRAFPASGCDRQNLLELARGKPRYRRESIGGVHRRKESRWSTHAYQVKYRVAGSAVSMGEVARSKRLPSERRQPRAARWATENRREKTDAEVETAGVSECYGPVHLVPTSTAQYQTGNFGYRGTIPHHTPAEKFLQSVTSRAVPRRSLFYFYK